MTFLIADTFSESLAKLSGDEQKAVKTTAFDLQIDPASPGMQFHKVERAKDPHFWSVRVNRDIRLIVHRTERSLLLCYVDHHDQAYRWATRRKLETHPRTGAAQFVEVRERVQHVLVPQYGAAEIDEARAKPPLFGDVSDDELLGYGVPYDWLGDVREANEDTLLDLVDHLPSEAAEALLELATGGSPTPPLSTNEDPFDHPDARRRFRVMHGVEELRQALDFPWEKWTVFLHPAQREFVEADFNGPARVSGSAGTGKTIVALHRAVHLARSNPDARILLTTFSDPLANALQAKVNVLIAGDPRLAERLEVAALDAVCLRLYQGHIGRAVIASRDAVLELIRGAVRFAAVPFADRFLLSEWEDVVDAWQLQSWEAYRDVVRVGRRRRLAEAQRRMVWGLFERVRAGLQHQGLVTPSQMYNRLAARFVEIGRSPFDFIVVDESQDLSVAQLRFLAAIGAGRPNSLFFSGDLGQRIFQQPFSWKALGVDVRGRSRTLRINYRTSHQIRMQADHLLGPEVSDVDGNVEDRRRTVSVFNGPAPAIEVFDAPEDESDGVGAWLAARSEEGINAHEIAVFVRSEREIDRARSAVEAAGLEFTVLDENLRSLPGRVSIGTMHLAKGLEYRAVAVMACDDEVIPLQSRIEHAADDADLEEVYNTERHLLYVACTRARDHLLVTGVDPGSEFLEDLRA